MKSYDYEACSYDGEIYCNEHLPRGITTESDGVMPVFADSEWDSYPICHHCGFVHDYVNLTSDGVLVECNRLNIKLFHVHESEFASAKDSGTWMEDAMNNNNVDWDDPESIQLESGGLAGWYWWARFPGCLPEGEAIGPFKTKRQAAENAIF